MIDFVELHFARERGYLYNSLGEEVLTGVIQGSSWSIDLTDYPDGTYLFKLISSNIVYEYKIVKT